VLRYDRYYAENRLVAVLAGDGDPLLRQTGLPFAETASKPLLVLPVLKSRVGLMLWEAANLWRTAWSALPIQRGLVPMIVPLGDLADISDVDASQAMLGDETALEGIVSRYQADMLREQRSYGDPWVSGYPPGSWRESRTPDGTIYYDRRYWDDPPPQELRRRRGGGGIGELFELFDPSRRRYDDRRYPYVPGRPPF